MTDIPKNISVILPGYKEQDSVADAVNHTIDALRDLFEQWEIILIDDASTDRTLEIMQQLAAEHPEVRVLHNETNLGQGLSQRKGFAAARYELVLHNGMDCPFDCRDLPKMLPLLAEADIVVATRTSRPGYTVYRRIVSWLNRMLLRALFPLRLSDYNFVQVYRREVLDAVEIEATSAGFVVPEILIRAHLAGYRVVSVPIPYHRREKGLATVGSPKVVWRSFCELLRFWRRMRRVKKKQRRSASA